jgi:hypothetical protein
MPAGIMSHAVTQIPKKEKFSNLQKLQKNIFVERVSPKKEIYCDLFISFLGDTRSTKIFFCNFCKFENFPFLEFV